MFSNVNEEMSFSQRPTTDDGNGSWPTLCKLLPKGLTLWEHPPQTTRIHPSIIILKKFSIRPLRGSHFLLWNQSLGGSNVVKPFETTTTTTSWGWTPQHGVDAEASIKLWFDCTAWSQLQTLSGQRRLQQWHWLGFSCNMGLLPEPCRSRVGIALHYSHRRSP